MLCYKNIEFNKDNIYIIFFVSLLDILFPCVLRLSPYIFTKTKYE